MSVKPLISKSSKAQTVYGIVYGHTDQVLLRYIAEHIAELEDQYQDVKVVSISHAVDHISGHHVDSRAVWSALITCRVK